MKLIVGLGNPGARYRFTRHNMGFLVLDQLALQQDISIQTKGFDACLGKGKIGAETVLLAKPQTFMNLSGVAVRKICDYYQIQREDLIVAHDDLDLPFQVIRLKQGGGHGGHKGLMSLIDGLGGADFSRVRLGIGRPLSAQTTEAYVLESFPKAEIEALSSLITLAGDILTDFLILGLQATITKYQGKTITNFFEEVE